jgi:threonine dehydrogenase-like Zn-dependent dehydrogenase
VLAGRFDLADPDFPVSLVELPEPALPGDAWARVAVTTGGICGSDLHLFDNATGPSPTLVPLAAFPFVMGHEIAGRVTERGPECPIDVGTRVAVDPTIGCEARGIEPRCRHCAAGWAQDCLELGSKTLTPGLSLGYTSDLGGGWAEQALAHASMLHPIPDSVPDRAGSLHEPTSIAVHGLMRQPPRDGEPVAVVGAGIIGLCALAALRHFFPASDVTVLARHEHQAAAALAAGARHVVRPGADGEHFAVLAEIAGARVSGGGHALMLLGGFPYVVEAVGTPASVTEALRIVDNRGTVLLLGAAGVSEVDLTQVWFKEAALVGAWGHCVDVHTSTGGHAGAAGHSIDRALEVLAAGALPLDAVLTHEFPLRELRGAIRCALDRKGTGAIKVTLRP